MPFNTTPEFVRQLMEQNAALLKQNEELAATVKDLTQTIRELREQLNKNSKNSSKPPSSGGLKNSLPIRTGAYVNRRAEDRVRRTDMTERIFLSLWNRMRPCSICILTVTHALTMIPVLRKPV